METRLTVYCPLDVQLKSNTKAVWGAHGVFRPAPIDKSDPRKFKIEEQDDMTLPERRVGVSVCICIAVLREFQRKLNTRR